MMGPQKYNIPLNMMPMGHSYGIGDPTGTYAGQPGKPPIPITQMQDFHLGNR